MIRLRILREKKKQLLLFYIIISDKVVGAFRLKINSEIADQFYSEIAFYLYSSTAQNCIFFSVCDGKALSWWIGEL